MSITKVGKYDILRELGRGTMGVVYLGRDPGIQRLVAIKMVHESPGAPTEDRIESIQRFRREAQTAGNLSHPNIVTIYELGQEEGATYIAMEYVPGTSLESLLARQVQLPLGACVHIVSQVCDALDYAHTYRIVHRDIKPANIMLLDGYRVKVTDFGIAHVEDSTLTRTGNIVGTPYYMSPEQFTGHAIDGRSDLYSIGAILYELLTGEKPFGAKQLSTLMHRVLHTPPVPPCSINPTLPAEFDDILAKALANRPDHRYQSGGELVEALQPFAGRPSDWSDVRLGDTKDRIAPLAAEERSAAESGRQTQPPAMRSGPSPRPEPEAPEDMVYIEGGTYRIGSDTGPRVEGPAHDCTVDSLFIDAYPVTNFEYKQFRPNHDYPRGKGDHPVTNVSWFDAQAYAEWRGKRLPTEAEWEVAARGHTTHRWPWGNEFAELKCNTDSQGTVEVEFYPLGQSSMGVFDLCGNVWEWTSDWYQPYPGNASSAAPAPHMYRAIRGGSWRTTPHQATCTSRQKLLPGTRGDDVGFRCAMDAK